MKNIHLRMPVILSQKAEQDWLDNNLIDAQKIAQMLTPYPAKEFQADQVSTLVNSPGYDGPECIAPVPEASAGKKPAKKRFRD